MSCIFCKIIEGEIPSYTVFENDLVKVFLDVNPDKTGHSLIVPKKHFKDLYDIELIYLNEIVRVSKIISQAITKSFNPSGIKIVQNNGSLQEVMHYHMHIIPTYTKEPKLSLEEVAEAIKKNIN